MIAIPAIDLKDGRVVRLLHGDFKEEKVYEVRPEDVARGYESEGARRVHVVDLDGALKGKPANIDLVEKVVRTVKIPVEVGGGIRDLKAAERYFEMGVKWVILGTKACLDRGFMTEAVREFGERIIIGIDAKDGMVATDGWTKVTGTKAADLAKDFQSQGGRALIYTDISKDGALKGPNLKEVAAMADAVSIDVIASGGVGSLDDLTALNKLGKKNISGVIIGKALYEKKFSVNQAVRTCSQSA